MALFIMLYKVVLISESMDEIIKCDHSKIKATEQYFPVVLFTMQYIAFLTFESEDKIFKFDQSNES